MLPPESTMLSIFPSGSLLLTLTHTHTQTHPPTHTHTHVDYFSLSLSPCLPTHLPSLTVLRDAMSGSPMKFLPKTTQLVTSDGYEANSWWLLNFTHQKTYYIVVKTFCYFLKPKNKIASSLR